MGSSKITSEVKDLIRDREPLRVAIMVNPQSSTAQKLGPTPNLVVDEILALLDLPPGLAHLRYLVHQIWDIVDIFVLDIFNLAYDCAKAHLPQDLPVIMVHYSRRKVTASLASRDFRNQVNETVAKLHDLNGWETSPPYIDDHSNGIIPRYPNPRSICLPSVRPDDAT